MYKRERYFCGDSIEVEEKHTGRYGAPGEKRGKRYKPTPEQIQKQNQWKKERDIRRLLKCNFDTADYWTTLTYKKGNRPEGMQQAKQNIQKFIRKIRCNYKKAGQDMKYIVITEIGKRGGIHHHIVINRIEGLDRLIARIWQLGGAVSELIRGKEEDFRKLADYIAKKPAKENAIQEKWYSRSRNLKEPKKEERIMLRSTFTKKIQVPKGYYLVKDTVKEGTNQVTGHMYRYYTLEKINGRC